MELPAAFDPGNEHAVVYLWGTTGIGYNVQAVAERMGADYVVNSWDLTFNPETAARFADCGIAVLDDHTRWRDPLIEAANRLRFLGIVALLLIGASTAAMITLAAQAALATNAKVIGVLHLIGARDAFITRAFVRRYTLRTTVGAAFGTFVGMIAIATMPGAAEEGGFLRGLGFSGWQWIWPLAIPVIAAIIAFWATRMATLRTLRRVQ